MASRTEQRRPELLRHQREELEALRVENEGLRYRVRFLEGLVERQRAEYDRPLAALARRVRSALEPDHA